MRAQCAYIYNIIALALARGAYHVGGVCVKWSQAHSIYMEEQKETLAADRSAEEAEEFLPGFTSLEEYSKVIIICMFICNFGQFGGGGHG